MSVIHLHSPHSTPKMAIMINSEDGAVRGPPTGGVIPQDSWKVGRGSAPAENPCSCQRWDRCFNLQKVKGDQLSLCPS